MDAAIDQSAFHYPHGCLPSSGNMILEERIITLNLRDTRIKATLIRMKNDGGGIIMIYWYQWGSEAFARTEQMRGASIKNNLWYFWRASLNPFGLKDIQRDIQARQIVWYRFSTGTLDPSSDEQFLRSFITKWPIGSYSSTR